MAIDKEIFLQRMALLAGRIGRELEAPVQAEYYRQLTAALTTQQFVAAMGLAFNTWDAAYRTWPSPAQIVEMITPVSSPSLSAAESFNRVLSIASRHPEDPGFGKRLEDIQALGATTVRAFRAAGGFRDFQNVLESDAPWLRKRFVELYVSACENSEQERTASLALASASEQVIALVNATADKLSAPPTRKLAAGGGR